MTLPLAAPVFLEIVDPSSVLDWYIVVSQGDDPSCVLRDGEEIVSAELSPSATAAAAGLQIIQDGERAPIRVGRVIKFWTMIAPQSRSLAIYDGVGIKLGVELTIDTDAEPSRTKQMTVGQETRQK